MPRPGTGLAQFAAPSSGRIQLRGRNGIALKPLPADKCSAGDAINNRKYQMNRIRWSMVASCLLAAPFLYLPEVAAGAEQQKVKPLKVLMVTGGSSHDYDSQKLILSKGIAARANVDWTIAHMGGKLSLIHI